MNNNKYSLKYLPSFYTELDEIIYYITNYLKNGLTAKKLIDSIEEAIKNRIKNPDIFEVYKTSKNKEFNWYRIYIKNFTIFYTIKGNNMIISHIFYSKRDIDNLI